MRILIVGVSTRAIAESAVRGGYDVVTLDYFGDRDQKALVENYSLKRDFQMGFSANGLLQAGRRLDVEAVVYISNLENFPNVVEKLAQGRVLLGNAPIALRSVRDWRTLRIVCRKTGLPYPSTLLPGEEQAADSTVRWLYKPARGGSGHGIRPWAGEALDERYILQAFMGGQPASAAFVADGKRSVVIGLTEQLIGQAELGAQGFTWCGNILPLALSYTDSVAVLRTVEAMAAQLTRRFGLRGVNGLDFVVAKGPDGRLCPCLVEVNPRYTASMELVERAYGLNIFSWHLEAMAGRLPKFCLAEHLQTQGPFLGKGIVYARQTVTIPETEGWTGQGRRDVPFPGERIEAGHPVCTVLVAGNGRESCWGHLLESVKMVREEIEFN